MRMRLFTGLEYALYDKQEESGNWNLEKILWITLFLLIFIDIILAIVLAFICIKKNSARANANQQLGGMSIDTTSVVTATNTSEQIPNNPVSEQSTKTDEKQKQAETAETDQIKSASTAQSHKSAKH